MYDIIVVGTGFSGSIIARKMAEELNKKVLVLEKRSHIGGNAYDEKDHKGIIVQKYGPHYLNTNKYFIVDYLSKYTKMIPHDAKLFSYIDDNYVQLPFNFRTVQQLVGYDKSESLLKKLRDSFSGRDRVPVFELVNHEDEDVRNYGELLFEKAYKTYTAKQWGLNPDEIDKSVIERVPMAMNFDERYLNKDFQFLPENGFTEIFENMLNHPNIELQLDVDALDKLTFDEINNRVLYDGNEVKLLVFTGAIDELFKLKHGRLPYRSLNITYDYYEQDSVLPREIVSYPQAKGYIRKTEYKKINFHADDVKGTVVATEYPVAYTPELETGNIPYYPIITDDNTNQYLKYVDEVNKYGNIVLCGRLAEYKYYNMDTCIEHAFEKFEEIKQFLQNQN